MLIEFDTLKKYGIVPHGTFHVGMHKAEEYQIYKDAGVDTIVFVEANKSLVDAWKNDDENCYVVHAAVSDKVEEVEFHITNNGESSSILELGDHAQIYPNIVNIETVKMRTTTIDSINQSIGFNEQAWNILNLDIQGAELKAMKGLTDWSHIEAVFTEVNYREMYKGCALIGEIEEFLADKGFIKVEEVDTGAGWGDALFVKKEYVQGD
jgi:FkbM family methyltransferase